MNSFPHLYIKKNLTNINLAAYTLGATELKAATKYKYSDLKAATKNFSEKNKLGEGGFGAVYKVNLSCSSSHFNHDS